MALMARAAVTLPARQPFIWATWAFALPFLAMLAPGVQARARELTAAWPAAATALPGLLAAVAVLVALASGTVGPERLIALPVFVALALVLARPARSPGAVAGGWRLIGGGLALGLVAGSWDRALKIPVPGNTEIGLAFFLAVGLGLFLYTAVVPLASMNLRLVLGRRDLGTAAAGFAAVVVLAMPLGFALDFVVWNPRLDGAGFALARLLGLIVFVGIPEEMLFRGLFQEGLGRLTTARAGWIIASVIFGLSHITKRTGLTAAQREEMLFGVTLNWRYALLATIAGLGYGWVYRKTGRVSAAAFTHGAVNWVWSGFFGR